LWTVQKKAMKKTAQPSEGEKVKTENHRLNKRDEIKTDYPLSEKDAVKQAEDRMRKARKAET